MKNNIYVLILLHIILIPVFIAAQMEVLRGDIENIKKGEHSGNLFHLTFYNDGTLGCHNNDPEDFAGVWPIGTEHRYLMDGEPFIGSEVVDETYSIRHIISETRGYGGTGNDRRSNGDQDENESWQTFLPLPGFANPAGQQAAMSKWPDSWPGYWPDRYDDPFDPGWSKEKVWNGYFGKDVKNADEESFFYSDDYNNDDTDEETTEFFFPDENDRSRKGLGMRLKFRGFQWSNALVEDGIFILFDLENIGTYHHDKVVFGYKFGNNMGDVGTTGWDSDDDLGGFDKEEDVAYLWDEDDQGYGGYLGVGYFGGAFLESPGDAHDGIDNDGDGADGSGAVIDESMFASRTLQANENIVVIDYSTYERTVMPMPAGGIEIQFQNQVLSFEVGQEVEEIPRNLIDDNLNGIIDESNGVLVETGGDTIYTYLNLGLKYVDYFTGNGRSNIMLDEARDDGIDNDGDWNPVFDDVGMDGVKDTLNPDLGEGDGMPTDGEPHFDKTDIDETDMLGLTSFVLYEWSGDFRQWRDDLVWASLQPGRFDTLLSGNVELLYGSGYFPMAPGNIQRFSIGISCGINYDDFIDNIRWMARAYNENYNFAKAPYPPKVTAVAGDNKVTLYWDDAAENFYDPISGYDFEGYRIYRSTDTGWNDMLEITDGKGAVSYRKPVAQFDLDNEYEGYSGAYIKGIHFWLGENTGLQHSWTDSTVKNGFTYYYAVTSYDHGEYDPLFPEKQIPPSECPKQLSIKPSGEIEKGVNVVVVKPEAPSAGYITARLDSVQLLPGGTATGRINYKIIDPDLIKDNNKYRVTFEDTMVALNSTSAPVPMTKSVSLINVTNSSIPDTVLNRIPFAGRVGKLSMTDGFEISMINDTSLFINTDESGWSRNNIYNYNFRVYYGSSSNYGYANPSDYKIEFGEIGMDTSSILEGSSIYNTEIPVNFRIFNLTEGNQIQFLFRERGDADNLFTKSGSQSDLIIFMEDKDGELVRTWQLDFANSEDDSIRTNPQAGDSLVLKLYKPFLSNDIFEFITLKPKINTELAKSDLNKIRVVPNPYIVTNSWEPINLYNTGRGERQIHFIRLPAKCTIKIFTVSGQLVTTLEHRHESKAQDGTESWNMLTKDNLDIAYGLYIYHIKAPGIGEKIGKFAVIK
jgi:hypothetical protein